MVKMTEKKCGCVCTWKRASHDLVIPEDAEMHIAICSIFVHREARLDEILGLIYIETGSHLQRGWVSFT